MSEMEEKKPVKKQDVKWGAVLWYIHLHVLGLYAIWLMFTSAKWMTVFYTIFITALGCIGVTAGAHRLWAHRTYEAATALRLALMLCHTLAGVGSIHDWVLYHRLHHKYYGTNKDPYNHSKGFINAHYLSNILSPSAEIEEAKQSIDMRDIEQDGYIWFQKYFYWPMFLIFGLILPLNVPLEHWDESMTETIIITGLFRFAITVNISWLVNSGRLIWSIEGKKIPPDSISLFFIKQTFWPAYHYKVPWDFKSGEFGDYDSDLTTIFIKLWFELGLVDGMQTAEIEDVREMFHELAKKKRKTLDDGLEKLEEMSTYKMKQRKLMIRR